ncbi:MAG: hypothetical protein NTZ67_09500 [Gammaproteobacteria bacterium]|nr:hypothetical protein [Gammaproteobacteria bacterium]
MLAQENEYNENTGLLSKSDDVRSNDSSQAIVVQPDGSSLNFAQKEIKALPASDSPSTVLKVISFGVNNLLVAVHLIGIGALMTSLGPDEAAAAPLASSLLAVINGTVVGILLNAGYEIGLLIGNKGTQKEIGTVIRTSWAAGIAGGVITTSCFLSMETVMPYIIAPATGKAVGEFFRYFAIGSFSEPLGAANGMIIGRIEKGAFVPVLVPFVSMALYRLPALGFGYYFSHTLGMGAKGVGLGTAVASLMSYFMTQLWFSRKTFDGCDLYQSSLEDIKEHAPTFLSGGWKLALQRLSEWGNIAAIALLVGIWSNTKLQVLQPAIQANTLIALCMQGMGQAAMMFVSSDCAAQKKHYENFQKNNSREELDKFFALIAVNIKIFLVNNFAGVVVASLLSAGIYFSRSLEIKQFLSDKTAVEPGVHDLAESLLLINLLGQLPDAMRIISGGVLRGWKDLLFPTMISILLMTFVTVTAGWLIGHFKDEDPTPMFAIRDIAIALSALINGYRFLQHMNADVKLYSEGLDKLGVPQDAEERKALHRGWCSFMPAFRSNSNASDKISVTTSRSLPELKI